MLATLSQLHVGTKSHGARSRNKGKEGKMTCGLSRKSGTRSCMVSQGEVQAIHKKVVFSRGDAEKQYILSVPARGGTKIK